MKHRGLPSRRRQRAWIGATFALVLVALVVAYLAARPVVHWIERQVHAADVDV